MNEEENYKEINKNLWNEKTAIHLNTEFYDMESFLHGKNSLNPIEVGLLGDIANKDILHLQCHFGQDSISLARMGANVTGLDLSDAAIDAARETNDKLGLNAKFICSDVYEAPESLNGQFDIVFISYGTIGWLPDLNKWAAVIHRCLKPGGKLVFVEFHPVIWMFDYDFTKFDYSYFNDGAIVEELEGTYADKEANISAKSVSWNHSISEVLQGLLKNGLNIQSFEEYDYSPYDCFNNQIEVEPRKFQVRGMQGMIPMLYSVTATKTS